MDYFISKESKIQECLANLKPYDRIYLQKGLFQEKIIISQSNITIIGSGRDETIISNSDHYHKIMPDNVECNTFRTFTLKILGDNVSLENLTIENSAIPSEKFGQAVALHVSGDNFTATNCTFRGAQDTIFLAPYPLNLQTRYQNFIQTQELKKEKLTQTFTNCLIIGDVDFIFGCGEATFANCEIHSIGNGYISAPAHSIDQKRGFLFYKCNFTSDNPESKVFLARPWRDYGMAFFYDCQYGKHIVEEGFNKWNDSNRDKTCRFYEYINSKTKPNRAGFTHQLAPQEARLLLDLTKN